MEERRRRPRVAPLLRTRLLRIPAFAAGLGVQLAFAAGIQGFFLIFTIWVQAGQHYSPLRAGAFTHKAPYAAVAFLICAALSLVLPKTAVSDDHG